MADDEDWSDSDEDTRSEVETSVLLGVPDGKISNPDDLLDAAVSRIGGVPAFLPAIEPAFSSSLCKVCSNPAELLMQLWCPFENSPMDRALYIWGCSKPGCQAKPGSVRAWRGLRFNEKYAEELGRRLAKKTAIPPPSTQMVNPFSMNSSLPASGPSAIGSQIFGEKPVSETGPDGDDSDNESTKSLVTAMASTVLAESLWKSAPTHPAVYLSTVSEYLPPLPKPKDIPTSVTATAEAAGGKEGKDVSWAFEPYENSLEVDRVFERFTKRVGYEGEQCIRYELGGTPLPFSRDPIFDQLFPLQTTSDSREPAAPQQRVYDPSTVPKCSFCNSERVFECQVMPNLINVVRIPSKDGQEKPDDEAERQIAIQNALKGGESSGELDWGTCLVFSCSKDCRTDSKGVEEKDVWREEIVLVQADV